MNVKKYLKIIVLLIAVYYFPVMSVFSQSKETGKRDKTPVKNTFESTLLINSQTTESLRKNTLQFDIQHRFGRIDKEFTTGNNFDLFGILGVANIRIGLTYAITNNLSLGLGITKNNYLYDFNWKYKILTQTKNNSMPVSVAYFGNSTLKTLNGGNETFTNKLSYFHQLLIARKFNKKLSLQLSPYLSHFNLIDTLGGRDVKHLNFGILIGGRFNVSPMGSVIFELMQPITVSDLGNGLKTLPSYGLGYEIATRGHVFQVFITNATSIITQFDMVENTNDFFKGEFQIGFNITRRWSF